MAHRVIRSAAFALVGWLCFSLACVAQTPAVTSLTFPALTGRVVDEAGLLSADDRAALTASLAELETRTTDQLVVVTLKSLRGTTIEDYGYQLGRHWRVGQKDRDSGVLLIVAASERSVRIEVGYGLEGTLTDAATKLIIENTILPAFKTGDMPGGIKGGVAQITQLLLGDVAAAAPEATQPGPAQAGTPIPVWAMVLLGVMAVTFLIFCAVTQGVACRVITQVLFMMALSSGRNSSGSGSSSFSGGGGSFGGGGSSGSW